VGITNITGAIQITGNINASGITANTYGGSNDKGGDITLSGTSIQIDGTINASNNLSRAGKVSLTATNRITLACFDMSKVGVAKFDCGAKVKVSGSLSGFVTNFTSGSGTLANPYVTTQQMLRVTSGNAINYIKTVSGNAYLAGKTYKLADLNGTASNGGVLTPRTLGTVYIVH
jgi:hypothetical protein